jgi:hypothetical protein
MGSASAKANNKAVRGAAQANMASVDQNIKQARLSYYDTTEIASRQAQSALGRVRNAVGFDSGISTTQYIAAGIADAEADQAIRRSNLNSGIDAFQLQKQAISAQAKTGSVSPGLAALSGGIQGAQTGLSIAGALTNLSQASHSKGIAEQQTGLLSDQGTLVNLQIENERSQLNFQRDLNQWQRKNFGAAMDQRNALGRSPFKGTTYFDWMFGPNGGYNADNPILPYAGGR